MTAKYVQDGRTIQVTAPYDVASGAGCMVGYLFGQAIYTAASGAAVDMVTTGVVNLVKFTTATFAQGDKVYWDNTNKRCTNASTGNKWIGSAMAAQISGDLSMNVKLNGFAS